jgi:hypothetical protein
VMQLFLFSSFSNFFLALFFSMDLTSPIFSNLEF